MKPVQLQCSQEVLKNNFHTDNSGTSLNTCLLQVSVGDRRCGQPEIVFRVKQFVHSCLLLYLCDVAVKTSSPHIVLEQKQALNITVANAMFSHHLCMF